MRETVWLPSEEVSKRLLDTGILVFGPFLGMATTTGLSVEWDRNCHTGCFDSELEAIEELTAKGCVYLGEL